MAKSFEEIEKDLKELNIENSVQKKDRKRNFDNTSQRGVQPIPTRRVQSEQNFQPGTARQEVESLLVQILRDRESPYYNQAQSIVNMVGPRYNSNQFNSPMEPLKKKDFFPDKLLSTDRRMSRQEDPNNFNAPLNNLGLKPPRSYSAPVSGEKVQTPDRFYSPRKKLQAPVPYSFPKKLNNSKLDSL